jgi:hypothetical protein
MKCVAIIFWLSFISMIFLSVTIKLLESMGYDTGQCVTNYQVCMAVQNGYTYDDCYPLMTKCEGEVYPIAFKWACATIFVTFTSSFAIGSVYVITTTVVDVVKIVKWYFDDTKTSNTLTSSLIDGKVV